MLIKNKQNQINVFRLLEIFLLIYWEEIGSH